MKTERTALELMAILKAIFTLKVFMVKIILLSNNFSKYVQEQDEYIDCKTLVYGNDIDNVEGSEIDRGIEIFSKSDKNE